MLTAMEGLFLYKLHQNIWDIFFGVVMVLFFSAGIVIFTIQIFNRKPQLIINEVGVWSIALKEGQHLKWEYIDDCYKYQIFRQKFICFDTKGKLSFKKKYKYHKLRQLDKKIGVGDFNIEVSKLEVDTEKLFTLFNLLRIASLEERKDLIKNFSNQNL